MTDKSTYVLYGVAERDDPDQYEDRDPYELVCQFFGNLDDLMDFRENLPGKYQAMLLEGIGYDDFETRGIAFADDNEDK